MNAEVQPSSADALVLILGLGETGCAAARWCARAGAALRLADTRTEPGGLEALRRDLADARVDYRLGEAHFEPGLLAGVTQIVLSPGLAPTRSPVGGLLEQARTAGIEIVGEIELFARALADLARSQDYAPRVLAVTGTNGKTTVTALARHLAASAGLSARAAGNIGPAALAALMEALDSQALPQVWVLELSSFQLQTTRSLRPDAAVVLNVTQDHLDWHADMEEYAAAKARIYDGAGIAIVNRDDPRVTAMVESLGERRVRSFGRDLPERVGDMGLDRSHGVAWLAAAEPTDFDEPEAPVRRKKAAAPPPPRPAGRTVRMMPADALRIRGLHNALNAQAALLLARCLDLGWGPLLRAVRDYEGEPHRMEFLRTIAGVDFINDSKGTNVGATVAGLEGLGRKAVLIAGGQGKGQDFSPLVPVVAQHARAVLLIGQDGPEIGRALAATGVHCEPVATLADAVRRGLDLAQPGDAVLLSPACASLDMFRNYPHRGQAYAEAVEEAALLRGEVA